MTNQKKRHDLKRRQDPENVIGNLGDVIKCANVLSVTGEFHADYNEMAVWVTISNATKHQEIGKLLNSILQVMDEYFLAAREPILSLGWSVGLYFEKPIEESKLQIGMDANSDRKLIRSVMRGDKPLKYCAACDAIYAICDNVCPFCNVKPTVH